MLLIVTLIYNEYLTKIWAASLEENSSQTSRPKSC